MDEVVEIVATVDEPLKVLEMRLAELEGQIQTLMAQSATKEEQRGRKTSRSFAGATKLEEGVSASAVDAALGSLSVEQRIAVKMEMLRNGILG